MAYWSITSDETEAMRKASKQFFVEAKKKLRELRDKQARELAEFGRHLGREFQADVIEFGNGEERILSDLGDIEDLLSDLGVVDESIWDMHWENLSEELDTFADDADDALESIAEDIREDEEDE